MSHNLSDKDLLKQVSELLNQDAERWEKLLGIVDQIKSGQASVNAFGKKSIEQIKQHVMGLKQFATLAKDAFDRPEREPLVPKPPFMEAGTGKKYATAEEWLADIEKDLKEIKKPIVKVVKHPPKKKDDDKPTETA